MARQKKLHDGFVRSNEPRGNVGRVGRRKARPRRPKSPFYRFNSSPEVIRPGQVAVPHGIAHQPPCPNCGDRRLVAARLPAPPLVGGSALYSRNDSTCGIRSLEDPRLWRGALDARPPGSAARCPTTEATSPGEQNQRSRWRSAPAAPDSPARAALPTRRTGLRR